MKLPRETGLLVSVLTAILFFTAGDQILADLSQLSLVVPSFFVLFLVMLWGSFGVVRHADCLAVKLGEPFGTLILTLAVITIEVVMISAVMLTGAENQTLGRDMMFSVLMIVLNGLVGLSLLLGGMKHFEQDFNLQGVNTFLTVLIPLAVLGLILPNMTQSTAHGTLSVSQMVFLGLVNIALYSAFLGIQTMRHTDYFRGDEEEDDEHHGLAIGSTLYHAVMLVAYILPIVFLSKQMAKIVDYGITMWGAPAAFGGLIVAILVLAPEGMAAIKAAMKDNLQRSINICLGSALATIGMTIPAIMVISLITGKSVILGLDRVETLLLLLTFTVSIVNFSSARSNVIQGLVHLILFVTYLVMIFD